MQSRSLSISDILNYSPFDPNRDIPRLLTKNDFFDHLHVKTKSYTEQIEKFGGLLDSSIINYKIISITGFAGIGKTTFMHYFDYLHPDINFEIIDFIKYRPDHNLVDSSNPNLPHVINRLLDKLGENPKQQDLYIEKIKTLIANPKEYSNPILTTMKSFLNAEIQNPENDALKQAFLENLLINRSKYVTHFSQPVVSNLEWYNSMESLEANFPYILNDCKFKDLFILFFLYLFIRKNGKRNVIVFDNLDAVELDYLSQYFRQNFQITLTHINTFVDNFFGDIDFKNDFKFVFVMRDGNGSIVNSHIQGSFSGMRAFISFRIHYDALIYKKIVQKRIEFYLRTDTPKKKPINDYILAHLNFLNETINDSYINEVVVPMFNADIRKTMSFLMKITFNETSIAKRYTKLRQFKFSDLSFTELFGLRGAIVFEVLIMLKAADLFTEYPFYSNEKNICHEGHLSHMRLILVNLLNLSCVTRSQYVSPSNYNPHDVRLSTLFSETSVIFENKIVLDVLIAGFQMHSKNWSNMVTFREIPFDRNVELRKFLSKNIGEKQFQNINEYVNTIITLNPSGFVYLKYLLTHFEFYSVVIARNKVPLFDTLLKRNGPNHYLFDDTISKVYDQVSTHITQIGKCYNSKFRDSLKWSRKDFETSNFCFKHVGQLYKSPSGLSHSVRVIVAMIIYVDNFRRYIVCKTENEWETKIVNQHLLSHIKRFNNLFTIIDNSAAIDSFYIKTKTLIKKIENPDHVDITTSVFESDQFGIYLSKING